MQRFFMEQVQKLVLQLILECGNSRKELARRLQYPSSTSIDRIVHGNAGEKAVLQMLHRIANIKEQFSSESQALFDSLQSDMLDASVNPWLCLFQKSSLHATPHTAVVHHGETTPVLPYLVSVKPSQLIVIGCNNPALTVPIADYITHCRNKGLPVPCIRHYIHIDANESAEILNLKNILPLIFERNYTAYMFSQSILCPSADADYHGIYNAIFIASENNTSDPCHKILLSSSPYDFFVYPSLQGDALQKALLDQIENSNPKQLNHTESTIFHKDYTSYLTYCLHLEKNHAVYRFKPDIGIELIPYEILSRTLHEGPYAQQDPSALSAINELIAIEKERYLNSYSSTRSRIHIIANDMKDFIQTGRLYDHFWGCRPFTIEERKAILINLIGRTYRKDAFELRFYKQSHPNRQQFEITCYENIGLSLIRNGTDYNLSNLHSETMITSSSLCKSYIQFYLYHLLPEYTYSTEESIEILKQLLAALPES